MNTRKLRMSENDSYEDIWPTPEQMVWLSKSKTLKGADHLFQFVFFLLACLCSKCTIRSGFSFVSTQPVYMGMRTNSGQMVQMKNIQTKPNKNWSIHKKRTISTSSAKRRHIDKRAENCPIFTVNIPDWRLRKQHTYSINFYLNVNKCQPASILESPLAPNSCRYHSYKSRHAENTLRAVVAMDLVSENGLIIQTKWVSNWI